MGNQFESYYCKYFLHTVKKGDKLWFVKNCSDGQLIAVSTYKSYNTRIVGPLIKLNLTNTELGWEKDTLGYRSSL